MEINPQIMVKTKVLLVDADAFVALVDPFDSSHKKAVEYKEEIKLQRLVLITSDPAFGEAITVLSQNTSLQTAIQFADEILKSETEIIEVDSVLRKEALGIFKKQTSKNSRFTDCMNMAIMKKMGLNTIFSFDIQYKRNKFKRFGID